MAPGATSEMTLLNAKKVYGYVSVTLVMIAVLPFMVAVGEPVYDRSIVKSTLLHCGVEVEDE
jgi:hypothetical protein